jgi:hypothetical protein
MKWGVVVGAQQLAIRWKNQLSLKLIQTLKLFQK